MKRTAGVLVHPTSLPGGAGIGDLGPGALGFLDWAAEAGLGLWQVLPLGPPGYGDSPYSALSSFAGNPLLISLEHLVRDGWLARGDADQIDDAAGRVDFGRVGRQKMARLRRAWSGFRNGASAAARDELEQFATRPEHAVWLDDWALYAAIKEQCAGTAWAAWDPPLRDREPQALAAARHALREEVDLQRFLQFLFFRQWHALRDEAARRAIAILGDVPFYPAHDSADVWAHRELFRLDATGRPTHVAGVPPDYFSLDGQLWGNPVYAWGRLAERRFDWWIERLRSNFELADSLRLDHFRGFVSYWEVEASAPTAVEGRWVRGPGAEFFDLARAALGDLPVVAEDLGDITPDVLELREGLGFPGMCVLQFAFDEAPSDHHWEHHVENCVVYTGTHDNDTIVGWFRTLEPAQQARVLQELGAESSSVGWRMIEAAWASAAGTAIVPLQDLLGLGSEARMNRPGVGDGNWSWRVGRRALTRSLAERVRRLGEAHGRAGATPR